MKQFLQSLIQHGMCDKYKKILASESNLTKEKLVGYSLTLDGIDFLIASRAASDEFISDAFSEYINGVTVDVEDKFSGRLYVGYKDNIVTNVDIVNIIGKSSCQVETVDSKSTSISVSGSSTASLSIKDKGYTRIDIHDNSMVFLTGIGERASVFVTLYGDDATIYYSKGNISETDKRIKIRRKPKVTLKSLNE